MLVSSRVCRVNVELIQCEIERKKILEIRSIQLEQKNLLGRCSSWRRGRDGSLIEGDKGISVLCHSRLSG